MLLILYGSYRNWDPSARNEGSVYNVAVNPESGTVAAETLRALFGKPVILKGE